MEPLSRPCSTRNTPSPEPSQSQSAQDTSRSLSATLSATDLQQNQGASLLDSPTPAGSFSEDFPQEPSRGEQYPPESSFSSLHDISALAMSRHQSGSNPTPNRNPSIQLLSPESARHPRRMSQVSPGFIFVIFPMSLRCGFAPLISLSLFSFVFQAPISFLSSDSC
jgi:hypothetical protein